MPAVGRGDRVVAAQVRAGTGGDGLLADREVRETGDVAGQEVLLDAFFQHANADHRPQQRQAALGAGRAGTVR